MPNFLFFVFVAFVFHLPYFFYYFLFFAIETFYCQICLCNQQIEEGTRLDCGHIFCSSCIEQYLNIKIREAEVIILAFIFLKLSFYCVEGGFFSLPSH